MNNKGMSIASLVCGILGLSGYGGLVCGILALVFSKKAVAQGGENGMNKAGKILGIIGIVLFAVTMVTTIACGSAMACAGIQTY